MCCLMIPVWSYFTQIWHESYLHSDDQESSFPETEIHADTPGTSRTERTAGSVLTSFSKEMLTEKLAEAMGIQVYALITYMYLPKMY